MGPVEIDSLAELDRHLSAVGSLDDVVVQGLDLRGFADRVAGVSCRGTVLLGPRLDQATSAALIERGAVVFPSLDDLPFRVFRPDLYSVDELLHGLRRGVPGSFAADAKDSLIHAASRVGERIGPVSSLPALDALAQRLHDASIDDALGDLLEHHPGVVGIMGGHGLRRDDAIYRRIAEIGRSLARAGLLVTTGGGPGAMEAGNLGAYLANQPDDGLDEALGLLSAESDFHLADAYVEAALTVRDRFEPGAAATSLAVPTWFYGHEPTNAFATHIAKYFANSIREDGLLAIADKGVIFAPGSAGTTQEIFQDATQNHYEVFGQRSPMVLFGRDHWERVLPAAPLLDALARRGGWADRVVVTDDVDEAVSACL